MSLMEEMWSLDSDALCFIVAGFAVKTISVHALDSVRRNRGGSTEAPIWEKDR
jgi:hypothetical protein